MALKCLRLHFRDVLSKDVNEVHCHYELQTASYVENKNRDVFRCNPKFQGKAWFDWLHVNFHLARRQMPDEAATVPCRLLLWLTWHESNVPDLQIRALVHPMKAKRTPAYPHLPHFLGDRMSHKCEVVPVSTIKSVAYVFPGAGRHQMLESLLDKSVYLEDSFKNDYFVSVPEQRLWSDLGWESVDATYDIDLNAEQEMSTDEDSDTQVSI